MFMQQRQITTTETHYLAKLHSWTSEQTESSIFPKIFCLVFIQQTKLASCQLFRINSAFKLHHTLLSSFHSSQNAHFAMGNCFDFFYTFCYDIYFPATRKCVPLNI